MLLIANEVDPLIFRCVCFVCDTNMYFSNKLSFEFLTSTCNIDLSLSICSCRKYNKNKHKYNHSANNLVSR